MPPSVSPSEVQNPEVQQITFLGTQHTKTELVALIRRVEVAADRRRQVVEVVALIFTYIFVAYCVRNGTNRCPVMTEAQNHLQRAIPPWDTRLLG